MDARIGLLDTTDTCIVIPVLSKTRTAVERAGSWFVRSGIQEPNGGVARYYRSDLLQNARISTEITGYAVSTLVYLHRRAPQHDYLADAVRAGDFLANIAWNQDLGTFPFEHIAPADGVEPLAYFFDCGIIVRGLLALWRTTGRQIYLDVATRAGQSMFADFSAGDHFHPVLALPAKTPLAYTPQWSRSPGCYQLKSALGWHDLYEALNDDRFKGYFDRAVNIALSTHSSFLPAETPEKTMDRLHAYCYFLEALLADTLRSESADAILAGIRTVSSYLREIAPVFERSDVYAQLLRIRLIAAQALGTPLNRLEAEEEYRQICTFQMHSNDTRIAGGFSFGRRAGEYLPFINPVSSGFCSQAVEMWHDFESGTQLDRRDLI